MSSSAITGPVFSDNKRAPSGTAAAPSFAFNASTGTGVYLVSSDVLGLSTAGVQRVVVDASGNVGIGTGSPGTYGKLELTGGSSSPITVNVNNTTATANAGGVKLNFTYQGTTTGYILNQFDGSDFNTSIQAAQKLKFFTGASGGTERLTIDTNTVFKNGSLILLSSAIGPGAGTYPVKWNASTGVLTYDSSSRLVKDQIEAIPYGLTSVLSLQPRKYLRTDDQKVEVGFIADEVQSVIPEVVPMVQKSVFTKDEQDTELIPGGVNYEKLTAVLTKAIQEQQEIIGKLEARLAALESK